MANALTSVEYTENWALNHINVWAEFDQSFSCEDWQDKYSFVELNRHRTGMTLFL